MLKISAFLYLWLAVFIMIRYWYLSRQSRREASYRLVSSKSQAQKITYWMCIVTLFCFWPILLLAYPTDFVGAFVFNKKDNFNFLFFRMGIVAGFTVGIVSQLFK